MKVFIFTIVLTTALGFLTAVSFTLDNNIHPLGQYGSWNTAYSAAATGDTIYVYPSPYYYGSFNVGKRLTVIGGGFNPDNPGLIDSKISLYVQAASGEDCLFSGLHLLDGVYNSYRVEYSNCLFDASFTLGASNSRLSYCWAKSVVGIGNYDTPTNGFFLNGCTIEGSLRPVSNTEVTCANCVFIGNVSHIDCYVHNQMVCFFKNCIFLNSGTGDHTLASYWSSPVSLNYLNCIMENCYIGVGQTFQYCIFEGSSGYISGIGNQQSVNLANVMVDVNGGNYHLSAGSLAAGTGLNGEDIGLYGGNTPFNDLWYLTQLPSITEFTCPIVVDENGLLDVHVEAQAGN